MEIIFFTSNLSKLAHARYLLKKYDLSVQGFRERTYYANYEEPRTVDRTLLLKESYKDALKQAERAGILTQSSFFFLEDTSVDIQSLSTESEKVPGLDIKYWMQENTFEDVDALLKLKGNDRRVIVRSHVLLHLPPQVRELLKNNYEYKIFESEQSGHIILHEEEFATNLMYPWLDNKTFNKWFCPADKHLPLGKMNIAEADRFDFRRLAFNNMAKFISEYTEKYIVNTQLTLPLKKLDMPLEMPSLLLEEYGSLVICGYPCAGKTTAGQYLAKEFGYLHIEASDFMRLAYQQRHGLNDMSLIADFALFALQEQPDVAVSLIVDYLTINTARPWVITGFRALTEIDALQVKLREKGERFDTLFVDTNMQLRFERMLIRNRPGDTKEIDNFEFRDTQQKNMGLDKIYSMCKGSMIPNIGTLDTFKTLLFKLASASYKSDRPVNKPISYYINNLKKVKSVTLQDAILISLYIKWPKSESGGYYTTTEIAHFTGGVFPAAAEKQKDNVSRYFNQSFYPYYEILVGGGFVPNKYRLSNTGCGKAVNRLRAIGAGWPIVCMDQLALPMRAADVPAQLDET